MELFHGTTEDFTTPDLTKARAYTDFGPGFYLTEEYKMANDWKKDWDNKHINVYEVSLANVKTCRLRIKRFEKADAQWAKYVYQNRRKNTSQHYDLVIGPLADNGLKRWFDMVDAKDLDWEEVSRHINFNRFQSLQYCFITEQSLTLLNYVKRR